MWLVVSEDGGFEGCGLWFVWFVVSFLRDFVRDLCGFWFQWIEVLRDTGLLIIAVYLGWTTLPVLSSKSLSFSGYIGHL